MTYELWSKASRTIIGAFETEKAALAAVQAALESNGQAYAEGLAMIREDTRGRSIAVAEGAALVERAVHAGRKNTRQRSPVTPQPR